MKDFFDMMVGQGYEDISKTDFKIASEAEANDAIKKLNKEFLERRIEKDQRKPRWDLSTSEDQYLYYVEVPGLQKTNINIEARESSNDIIVEFVSVARDQNRLTDYSHRLKLPLHTNDIKYDEIEAELGDGMLRILAPRHQGKNNNRKVKVNFSNTR